MRSDSLLHLASFILAVLRKHGKDYLTVKQVVTALPTAVRKRLALRASQPTTALVHKLTPHLGNEVQVYRGARTTYIGRQLPLEELILRQLRRKPGVSSKRLGRQLPVRKQAYLPALNALLRTGRVVCTLKDDHTPCLAVAEALRLEPEPGAPPDDRAALKAAYDRVGQGRSFVRIHRLRDHLQWPRERFDRVLRQLMADYTVELHGGDPSLLSEQEITNSFMDESGTLYLTLSWRGTP